MKRGDEKEKERKENNEEERKSQLKTPEFLQT